jgi:pseudoazurin
MQEPQIQELEVRRMMLRTLVAAAAAAILVCGTSFAASAADYQVKMLNKGPDGQMMAFDPAFLKIAPGDSVTFVPVNKGHDVQSIDGMIPDGAQPWKGKVSQEITVQFTQPGVYGYKCLPHFGLGMVGLIEVGDNPANLQAAEDVNLPPRAQKRMQAFFAEVK